MKEYILICSCSGQAKRAGQAFAERHPDTILPEIIKGRDRIYKLAKQLDNAHIEAISKLTGRYAYYVKLDENNTIVSEEELITGRRTR